MVVEGGGIETPVDRDEGAAVAGDDIGVKRVVDVDGVLDLAREVIADVDVLDWPRTGDVGIARGFADAKCAHEGD